MNFSPTYKSFLFKRSIQKIRLALIFSVSLFSFQSCSTLVDLILYEKPIHEITPYLEVKSDCYPSIFGISYVEGTIRNYYHSNVKSIQFRVKVYGNANQLIEESTFYLSVDLTPDGIGTFKHSIGHRFRDISRYELEVISAKI